MHANDAPILSSPELDDDVPYDYELDEPGAAISTRLAEAVSFVTVKPVKYGAHVVAGTVGSVSKKVKSKRTQRAIMRAGREALREQYRIRAYHVGVKRLEQIHAQGSVAEKV